MERGTNAALSLFLCDEIESVAHAGSHAGSDE